MAFGILIVEDEPDIRLMLNKILSRGGYEVFEAHSGNSAIKLIREQTPDLIVTDVYMPDGDGATLLEDLKSTSQSAVPVVILTGYSYLEPAELIKFGAKAYLSKPFQSADLLRLVASALSQP